MFAAVAPFTVVPLDRHSRQRQPALLLLAAIDLTLCTDANLSKPWNLASCGSVLRGYVPGWCCLLYVDVVQSAWWSGKQCGMGERHDAIREGANVVCQARREK